MMPPLEIQDLRVRVPSRSLLKLSPLWIQQTNFQFVSYLFRNLALDVQDALLRTIIRLTPEVKTVRDVDELRRNAQPVSIPADAPFQYAVHMKLLADFL